MSKAVSAADANRRFQAYVLLHQFPTRFQVKRRPKGSPARDCGGISRGGIEVSETAINNCPTSAARCKLVVAVTTIRQQT